MTISFSNSKDLSLLLEEGFPALFPTDTVPALAATPKNAINLWKLKKRPKNKPLILMGASAEQLLGFVLPIALEDACNIGSSYWPGALTIILPAISEILANLNPMGNSIGMRVPACTLAIDLLETSGPLATTSANLSGYDPLLDPQEVSSCFPEVPLLGPAPWPRASGLASTLIKWESKGRWQLLRRGAVIPSEVG